MRCSVSLCGKRKRSSTCQRDYHKRYNLSVRCSASLFGYRRKLQAFGGHTTQHTSERMTGSTNIRAVEQPSYAVIYNAIRAFYSSHAGNRPYLPLSHASSALPFLPSHHTDSISRHGTACIREDAGRPLPTHGSDTITTGQKASHLYSQ